MEEKKFDPKQLIGYVLIMGLVTWMFYMNKPTEEELKQTEENTEVVEEKKNIPETKELKSISKDDFSNAAAKDSLALLALNNKLGEELP